MSMQFVCLQLSYEFEASWDCVTSVDLLTMCIKAHYLGLSLLVIWLFV